MLRTFTDISEPKYLSIDSRGDVLVAEYFRDRILLLNSELRLERVLVDTQFKQRYHNRLYFNELTSQLYVTQWCVTNSNINSIVSHISLQ